MKWNPDNILYLERGGGRVDVQHAPSQIFIGSLQQYKKEKYISYSFEGKILCSASVENDSLKVRTSILIKHLICHYNVKTLEHALYRHQQNTVKIALHQLRKIEDKLR